jgi:hypothetical protein
MSLAETQTRILVVGGHARNVGKTSLVVDLIRAFPEANWTAVKITQHSHGLDPEEGQSLIHPPDLQPSLLAEEHDRLGRTDTARYLAAGAARSLLLRIKNSQMRDAIPLLVSAIEEAKYAILESNAVIQFLSPALYLVVLDPAQKDFKISARIALDRADAFLLRSRLTQTVWQNVSSDIVEKKPHFLQPLGEPLPAAVSAFVRDNFFHVPDVPTS